MVFEHTTSTGQHATDATWLDVHFEAERENYVQNVQSVGIEPGWHVLDAGCGSGSFIPYLSELVGEEGKIIALDHAPENIEAVRQRLEASPQPCPVEPLQGSILDIPLANDTVDAIWLANVLMCFVDDELPPVLSELQRVTRPGGLIAAKESDARPPFTPLPMELLRELTPLPPIPPRIPGALHSRQNLFFFREAGLEDVSQRTVVSEFSTPLAPIQHQFLGNMITTMASARLADDPNLSEGAREWLEQQQSSTSDNALVNHPHFSYCGGHVVTVGRVPFS